MKKLLFYFALPLYFIVSCTPTTNKTISGSLFTMTENSGIDFINTVQNTDYFNIFNYRNFYNGGGVGIGDINNDGLSDVVLTSNMGENKLYLNKGNFQFEDISKSSGFNEGDIKWSTGVTMADINADGFLDIYICNAGFTQGKDQKNELYINNGNLTFSEKAAEFHLDDNGYTTHTSFFDYDRDGDLDAYILNNSFIPVNTLNYSNKRDLRAKDWDVNDFLKGGGDKLLRNDEGVFTDVSEEAGIYGSLIGFGLGVSVGDVNGDLWPDIYISNDFYEKDYLYINQKNGKFSEELEKNIKLTSMSSMGSDIGDINNDGFNDIFTTDMLPDEDNRLRQTTTFDGIDVHELKRSKGFYNQYVQNALQLNNGDGSFHEVANIAGVNASDWSWGALIFDANNDAWQDIMVCNGIYKDVVDQDFIDFFTNDIIQKMVLSGKKENVDTIAQRMPSHPLPNKLFLNLHGYTFKESALESGLGTPSFSNGAAYGDLDNDGDLDLVVNNVNQNAFVYQNNTFGKHYLAINLKGSKQNQFAVGAKIKVFTKDLCQTKDVFPARGFQSSCDYKLIFGLGESYLKVDSIKIYWPEGGITTRYELPIDTLLIFNTEGVSMEQKATLTPTLFSNVDNKWFSAHVEDPYNDFYYERGTFAMLSKEGPAYAKSDVNGDGFMDLFIGGARNQAGTIYLGNKAGFTKSGGYPGDPDFEDVVAVFFDADGDGDQDLFVGSGGNFSPKMTREMQDRIYLNDGHGIFKLSTKALPLNGMNTSTVQVLDFDQDGDNDLFVGSIGYPMRYDLAPEQFLYQNDGSGNFKNAIASISPELANLGKISDSKLVNIAGNESPELVVTTIWGKVWYFEISKQGFIQKELPLESGLWQSVTPLDYDTDGNMDLIIGNIGTNNYFSHHPMKLWKMDFDGNKVTDMVVTCEINGKDKPILMKRELTEMLPILKKNNLQFKDFADKGIQDLFDEKMLASSKKESIDTYESVLLHNDGNGNFEVKVLPIEFQLSNIKGILPIDYILKEKQGMIPYGNCDIFKPQFGLLTGMNGQISMTDNSTIYKTLLSSNTGLKLGNGVKKIDTLNVNGETYIIVINNNAAHQLYKVNSGFKKEEI